MKKPKKKFRLKARSNIQIDKEFGSNPRFGGCWSKDEMKNKKPNNKFWVINMADSTEPDGTHWVCVFDCPPASPGFCVYFDPFGLVPPPAIASFCKRSGHKVVYSTGQLQDLDSEACGFFCAHVLRQLLKGKKFVDVVMGGGSSGNGLGDFSETSPLSNEHKLEREYLK